MDTPDHDVIDLASLADALSEHWSPKVVGRLNDQYIKVAKLRGEFVWHKHDDEDEMFLVLAGELRIEYADRVVHLRAGQAHVVPRGTLHRPVAEQECLIALIEPASTRHTGDVLTDRTRSIEEQLA